MFARIIALKGKHQVDIRKSAEKQLMTTERCFSADGQCLPPMLNFLLQRDKEKYLEGNPEDAWVVFNKSKWINGWLSTLEKSSLCLMFSPYL